MSKKIILEINNRLVFDDEKRFISYLTEMGEANQATLNMVYDSQGTKKPSIARKKLDSYSIKSVVNVYELGLAENVPT